MPDDDGQGTNLIRSAREGDAHALGLLLESRREALRRAADHQLRGKILARVDASDVVQQTFLEASRTFRDFQGGAEPELAAWLRQILQNKLAAAVRDNVQLRKRDVRRECPIDESPSDAPGPMQLDAGISTPSVRAIRAEETTALLRAIAELPEDQREAVRLRHLENRPLAEIAEILGRSRDATAGLIKRGVQALRDRMKD